MTREEAIKWLKVINTKKFGWDEFALQESQREIRERCEQGVREAIDMAIEALSVANLKEKFELAGAEWIPCSDRLPNESGEYLATIPLDADETYTEVLTFHKGRFYEDDDEWGATYHDDVLAWMPLPTPYGERKQDD